MVSDSKPVIGQSNIWEACLQGLLEQFSNFFDTKTPVIMVASRTDLREKVKNKKTSKLPFFAVQVSSASVNRTGYNAFALKHTGKKGPKIRSEEGPGGISERQLIYKFIPTQAQISIRFLTQSDKEVMAFTTKWLEHSVAYGLDYEITVGDKSAINIHVELEEQISYPDLELEDMGSLYTIETMVTLFGYSGKVERVKTINKVQTTVSAISSDQINRDGTYSLEEIAASITNFKKKDDSPV